jgi:predicted site-specific integrase-resolvase
MSVSPIPVLLNEADAAIALGCSVDTLQRMRRAGTIRFRRIGMGRGRIRYTHSDILDYLARSEENACLTPAKSDLTGSASDQTAQTGAEHGSKVDKHAASRLAQRNFRKPTTGSLNGMWRTVSPEMSLPEASDSKS